jgi:hypothetical protein
LDHAAAEWNVDDAARRASGMSDLAALLRVANVEFPVGGFGGLYARKGAIFGGSVDDGSTQPGSVESYLLASAALLDAV